VIVFDTSVLIAHLRGVRPAMELLSRAATQKRAVASVLSRVEIEGGMRSHERGDVARLLGRLRLEPVSDEIAARAAAYLRTHRRSHAGIDMFDYVIAATADVLGADLLTLNVRHFPMFKRLRPAF
jgi:predicted nucleic acid-binding protein